MIQTPSAQYPTAKTAWFKLLAQLENVPDLQLLQLVASTATETGQTLIAAFKLAAETVAPPALYLVPVEWRHVPLTPLYG